MQEHEIQTGEDGTQMKRGRRRKSASADGISDTPDYAAFRSEPKQTPEERRYYTAVESPDVKGALRELERTQAVRDSISRKLCAGSDIVTVDDLKAAETALAAAKAALAQLAKYNPVLLRHPFIAAATGTDNLAQPN